MTQLTSCSSQVPQAIVLVVLKNNNPLLSVSCVKTIFSEKIAKPLSAQSIMCAMQITSYTCRFILYPPVSVNEVHQHYVPRAEIAFKNLIC